MVVSPTHRLPLFPRDYSWCLFLLEAEPTPGPECDRKDYVNEKFQWRHRESNRDLSACSTVPQPTAPPAACLFIFYIICYNTLHSFCNTRSRNFLQTLNCI
jgi:hypothetical protein